IGPGNRVGATQAANVIDHHPLRTRWIETRSQQLNDVAGTTGDGAVATAGPTVGKFQRLAARTVRPIACRARKVRIRSEEHTSELQSLMRITYAVFSLKK